MAVVLSEDKCDIPGECLKKGGIPLKIAVYGVKGEERKSTGWHVTSKDPLPGQYQRWHRRLRRPDGR